MDDVNADWRHWFDRHGPALTLFARQRLGGAAAGAGDAEDVVQAAFVRFWKNRESARDPLAYLYACVASASKDHRRGAARRRDREKQAWFMSSPGARETDAGPAFEPDEIEQAMTALPEEQRDVVVLKVWGGLTFKSIAEALGIPLNTAASRYRYALASLKKQLLRETTV